MLGLQALLLHLLHDLIIELVPIEVLAQTRLPQLLFLHDMEFHAYYDREQKHTYTPCQYRHQRGLSRLTIYSVGAWDDSRDRVLWHTLEGSRVRAVLQAAQGQVEAVPGRCTLQ